MGTNEKLLQAYEDWYQGIARPFYDEHSNQNYTFSQPFIGGVNKFYPNKPTMMIVGQQARDWGKYHNNLNMSEIQTCTTKYMLKQLSPDPNQHYIKEECGDIKFNRSPFWKFIRKFSPDYNLYWTNIDKIHEITLSDKTKPLIEEEEIILNQRIFDGKSILEKEIEIVDPKYIIFVSGPNYHKSMQTALGIDLSQKPQINNCSIVSIRCDNELLKDRFVYWTYHPHYLARRKKMDCVITNIEELIANDAH